MFGSQQLIAAQSSSRFRFERPTPPNADACMSESCGTSCGTDSTVTQSMPNTKNSCRSTATNTDVVLK
eukprot:scaffold1654_cov45-Attheya_sp.AAC.3